MSSERLDKVLARLGYGSRKQVCQIIKAGRVFVNGDKIFNHAQHVKTEQDKIKIDEKEIDCKKWRYYMLNKPPDLVCACVDNMHKTVLSVFPQKERKGLFPVGRLDKDTEGFIIITNDGDFCHSVMSPRRNVSKVYQALVSGELDINSVEKFKNGITLLDGTVCKSADLEILGKENGFTKLQVTLYEGKYHQVKRMILAVGGRVEYLKRVSIGSVMLDRNLKCGEYRCLTNDEIDVLKNKC